MILGFGHVGGGDETRQNIAYIHEMLGQLRHVAQVEGADMLCYLIEMAYVEAGDLEAGRRPLSSIKRKGP
ncbi:hypothetical protein GAO09_19810 [Rhizobiales bacterium RZME27]|uniref:Uncharacterized protein n=1 Tax=Endobacterium cereale TaxID=2663029 RepID=A0A6A8AAQ1_9HYPH|nr:hypothetical protein [Endobacterium cereale]MEB2846072.1 hypothetical protein [Endobacterium cereale]MQY48282.1 hypothetical protein [Endobacterium cereale]